MKIYICKLEMVRDTEAGSYGNSTAQSSSLTESYYDLKFSGDGILIHSFTFRTLSTGVIYVALGMSVLTPADVLCFVSLYSALCWF
jgi:hypothetical protein